MPYRPGGGFTPVAVFWCAEDVRQLGGESPLPDLMEVKG